MSLGRIYRVSIRGSLTILRNQWVLRLHWFYSQVWNDSTVLGQVSLRVTYCAWRAVSPSWTWQVLSCWPLVWHVSWHHSGSRTNQLLRCSMGACLARGNIGILEWILIHNSLVYWAEKYYVIQWWLTGIWRRNDRWDLDRGCCAMAPVTLAIQGDWGFMLGCWRDSDGNDTDCMANVA